jgi:hypothetical protein
MVTIYKITSPTGRVYIGQTTNLKLRVRDYRRNTCKLQTKLYASLKKYGFAQHQFEVLEEVELAEGDTKEIYWIDFYKSFGTKKGMNMTSGGKRTPGIKGKHHYKAKKIYQWDFEGNFIKLWSCIRDVQTELGHSSTVIGNSVKMQVSAYGFRWTFDNKSPGKYRSQRIKDIPDAHSS